MSRHFSLNAWGAGGGQFCLIRIDADWVHGDFMGHWISVTVGLFGFCACLTYWPKGLQE